MNAKLARTLVLIVWAGFFAWLWATDEAARYVGPRTSWIIPFGTIVLGASAVAYGAAALRSRGAPLRLREGGGMVLMIAPLLAVLVAPNAELGALAASRKAVNRPADAQRLARSSAVSADGVAENVFMELDVAEDDPEWARRYGFVPGKRVRLVGSVVHYEDARPGTAGLLRFYISCCAADALPAAATIEHASAEAWPEGTWLIVEGQLARSQGKLVVRPSRVEFTAAPSDPYISAY